MTLTPATRRGTPARAKASLDATRRGDAPIDHADAANRQRATAARDAAASATDATYTIGEMAREFGVTLRTLRFYEDRKLLKPRRDGTMRIYGARDRARLATILRGKALGFTLTEIHSMIAAEEGQAGGTTLAMSLEQVRAQIAHLRSQREEIDAALAELEATERKLRG